LLFHIKNFNRVEAVFIDSAKISVKAGDGGDGVIAFRREKYVPKGGPAGGDGGNGGDIYLLADRNLATLLDFRYLRHYKAKPGDRGQTSNKTGRSGDDITIKVPCGTLIKDAATGKVLADLIHHNDKVLIAKGGRGGRGNQHFATSTDRAPRHSEPGTPGEEKELQLELKLLADIGLVGFPNAGKSTLISVISAAKPKIADYPFTTLEPNLGIVPFKEYKTFVVADIPGIIEGASDGKGLGLKFLKHIERTKALAILLPSTSTDLKADYKTLLTELKEYSPALAEKPKLAVISKMDAAPEKFKVPKIRGVKTLAISSVTGDGLDELKQAFWELIHSEEDIS
jgi:GTPase